MHTGSAFELAFPRGLVYDGSSMSLINSSSFTGRFWYPCQIR